MDGNASYAGERGYPDGPKAYQLGGDYNTKKPAMVDRAIYNSSTGGGTPAAPVSNNLLSIIDRAEGILERIHMLATGAENAADKLTAVALSVQDILLHVSRPMRWDSDHVILLDESIRSMAQEIVFANLLARTRIGLDFFDATISRTAAWVIGVRNMQKALLEALLTPFDRLQAAETALDFTTRLMLTEEFKSLPHGAVWSEFCARAERPTGTQMIDALKAYQGTVADRT